MCWKPPETGHVGFRGFPDNPSLTDRTVDKFLINKHPISYCHIHKQFCPGQRTDAFQKSPKISPKDSQPVGFSE